jgi:hypothetical protein
LRIDGAQDAQPFVFDHLALVRVVSGHAPLDHEDFAAQHAEPAGIPQRPAEAGAGSGVAQAAEARPLPGVLAQQIGAVGADREARSELCRGRGLLPHPRQRLAQVGPRVAGSRQAAFDGGSDAERGSVRDHARPPQGEDGSRLRDLLLPWSRPRLGEGAGERSSLAAGLGGREAAEDLAQQHAQRLAAREQVVDPLEERTAQRLAESQAQSVHTPTQVVARPVRQQPRQRCLRRRIDHQDPQPLPLQAGFEEGLQHVRIGELTADDHQQVQSAQEPAKRQQQVEQSEVAEALDPRREDQGDVRHRRTHRHPAGGGLERPAEAPDPRVAVGGPVDRTVQLEQAHRR